MNYLDELWAALLLNPDRTRTAAWDIIAALVLSWVTLGVDRYITDIMQAVAMEVIHMLVMEEDTEEMAAAAVAAEEDVDSHSICTILFVSYKQTYKERNASQYENLWHPARRKTGDLKFCPTTRISASMIYPTSTTRYPPTISLSALPLPPQPSLAPGSHPSFRPPPSPIGSSSTPPSPHVHPPKRTIPNPAHRRVRILYSALLHRRSAPSYTLFGIR